MTVPVQPATMAAVMKEWSPLIRLVALGALAALVMTACGGGNNQSSATVGPRPTVVPDTARLVERDVTFGQIRRVPGGTAEGQGTPQILFLSCKADVVTVATTGPTVYAALPCERFPAEVVSVAGKRASIRLQIKPQKLFIQSEDGHQVEFSPTAMWVDESP